MRGLFFILTYALGIHAQAQLNVTHGVWQMETIYPGGWIDDGVGCAVDSFLFVGTGIDANYNLREDWWSYNVYTKQWTREMDLPGDARQYATAIAFGEKIYLMGGALKDQTFSNEVFVFNKRLKTWSQLTSAPWSPRGAAAHFISQ